MGSNSNPIGVIDSGVGGLSMVIALDQLLSSEEIVYVADPLHFPYGEKAKNELIHIVSSLVSYLNENLKAKLIITATEQSAQTAWRNCQLCISSNYWYYRSCFQRSCKENQNRQGRCI